MPQGGAFPAQAADLEQLSAASRRRRLIAQEGVDFSSNDYLGLAASPELAAAAQAALARGVPVGSGGSRLLRGNHPEHEALEAEAAALFGVERALWFSSGFAANSALFSTLPQRGDLIIHDELIHASAHEGMRLGRAECVAVRHNDANAFELAASNWRGKGGTGRIWLAAESLYSMDGDRAPLDELAAIADRHDAALLIDEAHATGLFGPGGRGLAAHLDGRENVITLRTCGKALGTEGALVCAPGVVSDFLVNRGPRHDFLDRALAADGGLHARIAGPDARASPNGARRCGSACGLPKTCWARLGVTVSGSQILPLIIGGDGEAMALAASGAGGWLRRARHPPADRAARHRAAAGSRSRSMPARHRSARWAKCWRSYRWRASSLTFSPSAAFPALRFRRSGYGRGPCPVRG